MSTAPSTPLWIGGRPEQPNSDLEVRDKFSGELLARVARAEDALIERAFTEAAAAREACAQQSTQSRRHQLEQLADRLAAQREALAERLCMEGGKPITAARGEADRAVATVRNAAAHVVEIGATFCELDPSEVGGRRARLARFPAGVCSFVTPFNFPLNLVAHKVAPAIAAGCPFVLKPASSTPLSALALGRELAELELPPGSFSILPATREGAGRFSTDERIAHFSFTGSDEVGFRLKAQARKPSVVLELGGNAAVIVAEDWPLDHALDRIVAGAFTGSGQSCISVQRCFVHRSRLDEFREQLLNRVRALPVGDPRREDTVVGPLISENEAKRVEAWIQEAREAGGRLLCGGEREGSIVTPAVLEEVPESCRAVRDELFGPALMLFAYDDFEDALGRVNAGRFGLQAGLLTEDAGKIEHAFRTLEVGGLIVGDAPSWRADPMPYGGVKDSGLGREGPRYAVEHMTELRLLVTATR